MKKRLLPFVLAGALTAAFAAPAAANNHTDQLTQGQVGGAAGLIAAVVQVQTGDIDVTLVDRSLNNLLRNADIDVLNNVLNNVLRDADIDIEIEDILNDNTVILNVLSGGVEIGEITVSP